MFVLGLKSFLKTDLSLQFPNNMEKSLQNYRSYFKDEVGPIFEDLISKIILKRPEDIIEYALKYFKNNGKISEGDDDDPFLHEEVDAEEFIKERREKLQKSLRKRRNAVSSEANSLFNINRKPISLRKAGVKEQKTQIMIKFYFSNTFLFKDLSQSQQNFLIQSMVQEKTQQNQIIIKQGQYGDCMYFIEDGFFECSVSPSEKNDDKRKNVHFLKNYQSGDSFGEICLLHSAKRQATIISRTDGMLYSLSRESYKLVNKMSISKKRSSYLEKLMNVNIFANLSQEDFEKLCDLLRESHYQAENYIIYEGDIGDRFFIVIEGLLAAKSNSQQTLYQYYKQGDYFGQLSLLNNKPRQLSVQAITKCRLVSLTRQVFLNVINRDKADFEMKNKYRQTKPITNLRKKKNTAQEI